MLQKIIIIASLFLLLPTASIAAPNSVFIEELTSPEIAELIKNGYTTAIIPTGGSEQNKAHLVIGKHNYILHYTAGEIAKELGNALVAPVMGYVPEGKISPPEGHMNFAGTLSLRPETFAAVLEDTAASLKQHGFRLICLVGEHGGSQEPQKQVAEKLSSQWEEDGVKVISVSDYYANNGQDAWIKSQNIKAQDQAGHASFEDSSELMATYPQGVRKDLLEGDAKLATSAFGKELLELKIKAAVKQIKNASRI